MSNPTPLSDKKHAVASRVKPILLCVLLIIGGGVAHGYLDNRWTDQNAARVKAEALLNLPAKIGKWELASSSEIEGSAKRILQCYGSILQEYVNNTTGAQVTVFVVCGPRGPIAVHTPEVCYSSSGTEPAGDRVASPMLINGDSQSLWTVKFRKPRSSDPPHLEVWYGWSDGGPWQAASLPRVWLTDTLYKIQAAGTPAKDGEKTSPVEDFLEEFLPVLQQAGVGTAEKSTPLSTP
ncbi:EpsI family protein [Rhodopirellula sp.]|nr:EpsI family protein [Rhodopirellula sp.]